MRKAPSDRWTLLSQNEYRIALQWSVQLECGPYGLDGFELIHLSWDGICPQCLTRSEERIDGSLGLNEHQ